MADQTQPANEKLSEQDLSNEGVPSSNGVQQQGPFQEDARAPGEEVQEADNVTTPVTTPDPPTALGGALLLNNYYYPFTPPTSPAPPSPAPGPPTLESSIFVRDEDIEDLQLPPPALPLSLAFPMSSYSGLRDSDEAVPAARPFLPLDGNAVDVDAVLGSGTSSLLRSVQRLGLVPREGRGRRVAVLAQFMAPSFFDLHTDIILIRDQHE
ncbi:hypothetical protein OH76DRAFT_1420630 [Lentinus brumalis]|uniref:Uncharacterized protein n=1 Tax=Lentinus brumalis TaxID=2498619 RepID=A0A371CZR0_9APHY|nr:hypothetical protein OH76DRAFT_1420630 [Polyporus brumalis]